MIKHKKLGVIFIDCWDQNWQWENTGGPHSDFYLNMLDTLQEYDVDSYVFHTSFLSLNYITQDVVHYFNEYVAKHHTEQDQRQGIKDLVDATGTERLSRHLTKLANSDRSIFIPTYEGFVQWCQTSDIANWIVVGAHWPICTHHKPLGFVKLAEYKQQRPHLHFYSIPSCTAKWVHSEQEQIATTVDDADYANDMLRWRKIGENLYELQV